jgi:hypothetical protein
MNGTEFQKAIGVTVNRAAKDGVPTTQIVSVLDMLAFELKFKLMRQLEAQNSTPFKMELENGGDKSN